MENSYRDELCAQRGGPESEKGVSAKQEKTWYINILMTRTDSSTTDPFFAELLRVIESEIHDKTAFFPKYGIYLCFPMTGSAEGRIWTG